MNEIIKLIESIRQQEEKYESVLNNPIKDVLKFRSLFKSYFEIEIDEQYVEFLRIVDGIECNGQTLFSSFNHSKDGVPYGIFENNNYFYEQDSENKKYVLFGNSGMDLFVFDKTRNSFQVIDRYSLDSMVEFNSFEEFVVYILKLMLF